jgi:hypothetical protein
LKQNCEPIETTRPNHLEQRAILELVESTVTLSSLSFMRNLEHRLGDEAEEFDRRLATRHIDKRASVPESVMTRAS